MFFEAVFCTEEEKNFSLFYSNTGKLSGQGTDRPSDRVRLKNANYAIFSGQIVRLERPIMR